MTDKSKGVNLMAFRISPWCRLTQVFFSPLALGPSSFPMHDPMHCPGSYDTASNFLDLGKLWSNLCKQNVEEFSNMVTEYMRIFLSYLQIMAGWLCSAVLYVKLLLAVCFTQLASCLLSLSGASIHLVLRQPGFSQSRQACSILLVGTISDQHWMIDLLVITNLLREKDAFRLSH